MKRKEEITIWNVPIDIPESRSGPFHIDRITVDEDKAAMLNAKNVFSGHPSRRMYPGTYVVLNKDNCFDTIMSDTKAERNDHYEIWHRARGHVLLNGLGLGLVLAAIAYKEIVSHITVVEVEQDIINLVAQYWIDKFPKKKIEIIHADAFTYKPPKGIRYNTVWHDIWNNVCADNMEEMHKLHRKYGKRTDWQGSWCRYACQRLRGY